MAVNVVNTQDFWEMKTKKIHAAYFVGIRCSKSRGNDITRRMFSKNIRTTVGEEVPSAASACCSVHGLVINLSPREKRIILKQSYPMLYQVTTKCENFNL